MKISLEKGLERVHKAEKAGRIDQALAELQHLMDVSPENATLLMRRAELIQIGSENAPPLADAKECLRQSTELEGASPACWLELGHFALAVEDDAKAAIPSFDKAIRLCQEMLTEALAGKAKALAELKQREEALACLAKAYWVQNQAGDKTASNGTNLLQSLEKLRLAD